MEKRAPPPNPSNVKNTPKSLSMALLLGASMALGACQSNYGVSYHRISPPSPTLQKSQARVPNSPIVQTPAKQGGSRNTYLAKAIAEAPAPSKRVLQTIDSMIAENTVVRGSCWDYLNAAFDRAGYPSAKRAKIFKGKYKQGPYADANLIQPGDWLYYVNHSYGDVQHSGLFIEWSDRAQQEALIFSYAGEGRSQPARFGVYHIDQVYTIIRAKDD